MPCCGRPSRKSAKSAPATFPVKPPVLYSPVKMNDPFAFASVWLDVRSNRKSPPALNWCVFQGSVQLYDAEIRLSVRRDGVMSRRPWKPEKERAETP